jgi:hypothetical protein
MSQTQQKHAPKHAASNPTSSQLALLNLKRCVRSGTAGLRDHVSEESIITLGEHLRLDLLRSD